ncbi:MAG: hypothetical protein WCP58_04325 [bacterium]
MSTIPMNGNRKLCLLSISLLVCLLTSCALPQASQPSSSQAASPEAGAFFYSAVGEGISLEVSGRDEEPATPTGLRRIYLIPWLGILLRGGGEGPEDGLTLYFPKDLASGVIRLSPFADKPGRPRAGEVTALFYTQGTVFGALEGELSIESVGDDQTLTGSFQLTAIALSDPNRTVRLRGWFRRIPLYPPPLPSGEVTSRVDQGLVESEPSFEDRLCLLGQDREGKVSSLK